MCFHAYSVHAGVRTNVACHVFKELHHVIRFLVIDDFRSSLLSQLQAVVEAVNSDHAFSSQKKSATDGELAHGTAAPDGHGVARPDIAVFGAHVPGRKDIGEKD